MSFSPGRSLVRQAENGTASSNRLPLGSQLSWMFLMIVASESVFISLVKRESGKFFVNHGSGQPSTITSLSWVISPSPQRFARNRNCLTALARVPISIAIYEA